MTPRSLAGLALTVAALMSAFVLMAPTAPGLFVGVLTVGTFGFGPFYGCLLYTSPSPRDS